jgi:hypothetical protein
VRDGDDEGNLRLHGDHERVREDPKAEGPGFETCRIALFAKSGAG